jgi:antitoxin (DNA-binding transcriptional repressor) of toxin-antitoxin stability system
MIQIDLDKIVPIEDLPGKLNQVIDDAHAGAIYVVTKDDRPTVALVSVDQLEGLSGRKVITPLSAEAGGPPPPPPAPAEPPAAPPPPALEQTAPPPASGSDLPTPITSVQRDLTPSPNTSVPGQGTSPTLPPPPTTNPPAANHPNKPPEEMPL